MNLEAAVRKPSGLFKTIDTSMVREHLQELYDHITFGVEVKENSDGKSKLSLRIPFEHFERAYAKIYSILERSQFLTLEERTRTLLDNLHNFRSDPKGLITLTKDYIQGVRMQIDWYEERMKTKEALHSSQ